MPSNLIQFHVNLDTDNAFSYSSYRGDNNLHGNVTHFIAIYASKHQQRACLWRKSHIKNAINIQFYKLSERKSRNVATEIVTETGIEEREKKDEEITTMSNSEL